MATPRFEAARILGERLRGRRMALGLSQYEVASLSQVDLANYGKVERGVGNPTLTTLLQLAITLEIEPHSLLDGLAAPELLPERQYAFTASDFVREQKRRRGTPDHSA
ncbi:helix-turn-helix domain-containing protein [Leifsonia sp. Leaf336]|uniref:helix-turn-helix domain-containing protein n=1 Tax=Leifsonia sp. Leaf336 TaxID=1736341 RepID=UPI0009E75401|nr:helix-turn-helix transcriptional regulator [Leifsonia sp. Leaf336]